MAESGALSDPDGQFRAAYGAGDGWQDSLQAALSALSAPPEGANLGLVYVTDGLADHLADIVARLRAETGIADWLGTVGTGVSACGLELHDRPAVALLAGALPTGSFRVFEPVSDALGDFEARHGSWIAERAPYFGIVHGDPRAPPTCRRSWRGFRRPAAPIWWAASAPRAAKWRRWPAGWPKAGSPAPSSPPISRW